MPSMKSESPATLSSPGTLKVLFLASRPRTWIASISPVLIGTALAAREGAIEMSLFFLTLCFALLIQIGTNFANDAFDFLKGADTTERIGPKRATQQGWISSSGMLRATLFTFLAAILVALPLMVRAGWWSFPIAVFCVLFGIGYTGGPKPLGYLGLGEALVFLFFGPIAVCGTYFLQTFTLSNSVFLASIAPGLFSCSLLIANNLRDEENDRIAGKRTLIVRFGKTFGRWEYALAIVFAALVPLVLQNFLPLLILPLSFPWIKTAFSASSGREFIPLLQGSALLLMAYTALFCLASMNLFQ